MVRHRNSRSEPELPSRIGQSRNAEFPLRHWMRRSLAVSPKTRPGMRERRSYTVFWQAMRPLLPRSLLNPLLADAILCLRLDLN